MRAMVRYFISVFATPKRRAGWEKKIKKVWRRLNGPAFISYQNTELPYFLAILFFLAISIFCKISNKRINCLLLGNWPFACGDNKGFSMTISFYVNCYENTWFAGVFRLVFNCLLNSKLEDKCFAHNYALPINSIRLGLVGKCTYFVQTE